VDHVSAYALTLDDPGAEGLTGTLGDHLPTTAGARRWRASAVEAQDEDRAAAQYGLAVERLGSAGLRGYEISNWARPGHESRHNLVYWRREPYEAVGPGAHAFDGSRRRWNAARLDGYLAALAPAEGEASGLVSPGGGSPAELPSGGGPRLEPQSVGGPRVELPPGGSEPVDGEAAAVEAVILGLRLHEGLARDVAGSGPLAPHLAWALEAGLLEIVDAPAGERVRLTTEGRLLSNELFARVV
jgi:coproporphyrinogen III oxidase-like Fe-S oxidoreductase